MNVDLTNCDREPIHIPGAIQPIGVLLAFGDGDLRLTQYSQNASHFFGRSISLDAPLEEFFSSQSCAELRQLEPRPRVVVHPLPLSCRCEGDIRTAGGAAHHFNGTLIVEIEASSGDAPTTPAQSLNMSVQLKRAVEAMQAATDMETLFQEAADRVRLINGFDRVMVYQFLEEGHGKVVGEAACPGIGSFLGMHYPATDIPQQARRLYLLNPVRLIANVHGQTVPIVPQENPRTRAPLDLTYSYFRAVSPIHLEYLRNMGVEASMSISIVDNGTLWGLIACHHYQPRYLTIEQRAGCEILGLMAASYITSRQRSEAAKISHARRDLLQRTLLEVAEADVFEQRLAENVDDFRDILDCDGVAIYWRNSITFSGATPNLELLEKLFAACAQENPIWLTDQLSRDLPEFASISDIASGALIARLDSDELRGIAFFRREYAREVTWAGNPEDAVKSAGAERLTPRHSFEAWQEMVHGRSRPWTPTDQEVAVEVRSALVEILVRRAAELTRINQELKRINADLDAFAYTASHDLREPLRGLNQTIFFLLKELDAPTRARLERRLQSIDRLSNRMQQLLDGLLRLSRVGRADLEFTKLSMDEAASEAAEMTFGRPHRSDIDLILNPLGSAIGDFLCLRELFSNLLSNAAKYSDKAVKRVEIGVRHTSDPAVPQQTPCPVYFVRDDGIGIAQDQQESVFHLFRRLHLPDEYGGGSGAGLAIVHRIVARHGGRIWMESEVGAGTTVCFTLNEGSHGSV